MTVLNTTTQQCVQNATRAARIKARTEQAVTHYAYSRHRLTALAIS